jgi:hypothetical protein
MKNFATVIGSALLFVAATTGQAQASGNIFFGETKPGDDVDLAAQAQQDFLSNFDNIYTEDFEDYTLGQQASEENPIVLDFGSSTATLTGGGVIRNADFNGLHATSGENYWSLTFAEQVQDTYSIDFNQAQAAFGFYATDMGDAGNNDFKLKFTFEDETTETFDIAHGQTNAAELYFGYLNTDKLFTSVEFLANGPISQDGFGLDDVTIGTIDQVTSVPEPATVLGLLAVGALGIGAKRQRKA